MPVKTPPALARSLAACRKAAQFLRAAPSDRKNAVLEKAAELLIERQAAILQANARDLKSLDKKTKPAFRDRLLLTKDRLEQMAESLRQVAAMPDPVGEEVESKTLPNGLKLRKIRSPLGVIYMIFESRPNVAVEAFSLAFKAGNVIILRGGRESMKSVQVLYEILGEALVANDFPATCLWGITNPDRKLTLQLLQQKHFIDVVVPRGGDSLIEFVVEKSRIPIIKNDRGLCHIYVHEDADLDSAIRIIENAKTQRPGVCNAIETILVHERIAAQFLPTLYRVITRDREPPVEWYGCPSTRKILKGLPGVRAATAKSFDTEYLALKLNCRVVDSLEQAIEHIEKHGSRHSESILTHDASAPPKHRGSSTARGIPSRS